MQDQQTGRLRIGELAVERFALIGLTAIHRYGKIEVGHNIVLVVAAATHRQAAFDGANFVMDYLKTAAPFWKKEHGVDGASGNWVSARDADDAAGLLLEAALESGGRDNITTVVVEVLEAGLDAETDITLPRFV